MTYKVEKHLRYFEFWAGAQDTVSLLSYEEIDLIESALEDVFCDAVPTETDINDIFWFDTDFIAEILGYEDFETLYKERKFENSDKIYLIDQNDNGSWVIRGEYGICTYYFCSKKEAIIKYLSEKGA